MSLTTNTSALQSILATVNALPNAGSVATCTVTITHKYAPLYINSLMATTHTNGVTSVVCVAQSDRQTPYTIENVVCNSGITVFLDAMIPAFEINGDAEMVGSGYGSERFFMISGAAGDTITISAYDNG